MSLTTRSRTTMNTTPDGIPIVITADMVEGPGQGNWTYDTYAMIPDDGKRYQIVDGVLFLSPAPNKWHQKAVLLIAKYLHSHIEETGMGEVYIAPFDVELASNFVVQPDVLVLLKTHLERATDKRVIGSPDLVVEVASPGTAIYDRREKLDAYIQAGVPEYWIIDTASRTIEILTIEANTYHPQGIFEGKMTLTSNVIPDFPVYAEQLFAHVQQ